jgi:hypothetical protein
MVLEHLLFKDLGKSFSCDRLGTGCNEDHLAQSVYTDYDRVMAFPGERQVHGRLKGDRFPGSAVGATPLGASVAHNGPVGRSHIHRLLSQSYSAFLANLLGLFQGSIYFIVACIQVHCVHMLFPLTITIWYNQLLCASPL